MKLTQEKMASLSHILVNEVEQDLADTKRELSGYETEKAAIESVGVNATNKVRHYMLSAKCDKGREFVDELNQLIAFKKGQT